MRQLPANEPGQRHSVGSYVFVVVLVVLGFIVIALIVGGIIVDHDQHAAVAPLPRSEYSISLQSCTTNSLGEAQAVATLTRLTQSGTFSVVADFYDTESGKISRLRSQRFSS
jgi:cytochrome b subunit of formate dehydrogenase